MKTTSMLSTREAAARLGVSEASVRRWSDRGELPVQRVGRRRERRFRPEHLEGFATHGRESAPSATSPDRPQVLVGGQPVPTSTHLVTFYDSDTSRLRLTGPFLAEGLRAGQPCFLLAEGDELESYMVALRASLGVDLDAAIASGQLVIVGAPGATVEAALAFWEEKLWDAVDNHASVMRGVGEMVSERKNFESEQEMLDYEAAINMTLKRFPAVVICQYDVRKFSGQAVLTALRAHPDSLEVWRRLLLK
jgi:excisionase family DNA binding protein